MKLQLEDLGVPPGRYPARVDAVTIDEPTGRRPWTLRMTATLVKTGKQFPVDRELGHPDIYDLSPARKRGLRDFAKRLGVQHSGPTEEVVAALQALAGQTFTAQLRRSPIGLAATLWRNGSSPEHVTGEVVDETDVMPAAEAIYRPQTLSAQGAHQQLLAGLRHTHRGLALVAEACWRLRDTEGWSALGYDSIGAYLADPDISLSRSQFYGLADIYDTYVQRGGIDPDRLCAPSKLEVPLAALKKGTVTAAEAFSDAEVLGLRDLREKYRGQIESADSGRPDKVSFPFVCGHCGAAISSIEEVQR